MIPFILQKESVKPTKSLGCWLSSFVFLSIQLTMTRYRPQLVPQEEASPFTVSFISSLFHRYPLVSTAYFDYSCFFYDLYVISPPSVFPWFFVIPLVCPWFALYRFMFVGFLALRYVWDKLSNAVIQVNVTTDLCCLAFLSSFYLSKIYIYI